MTQGKRRARYKVWITSEETPLSYQTIAETLRKDRETGAFVIGRLIRCYGPDHELLWEQHEEVAQLWKQ